jgi:hypothetical protein
MAGLVKFNRLHEQQYASDKLVKTVGFAAGFVAAMRQRGECMAMEGQAHSHRILTHTHGTHPSSSELARLGGTGDQASSRSVLTISRCKMFPCAMCARAHPTQPHTPHTHTYHTHTA